MCACIPADKLQAMNEVLSCVLGCLEWQLICHGDKAALPSAGASDLSGSDVFISGQMGPYFLWAFTIFIWPHAALTKAEIELYAVI